MTSFLFKKNKKKKSANDYFYWQNAEVFQNINQEQFLNFFNSILDGVAVIDYKGKILFFNSAAVKILETDKPEKLIGKNIVDFLLPESKFLAIKDIIKVRMGQGGYLQTYKIKTAKGKEKYIENIGTKSDFFGKSVMIIAFRDITKRIISEENLNEEKRKTEFLNEVISSANKHDDIKLLLEDILNLVLNFFDFDGGGIYLVNQKEKTANIAVHKNLSSKFLNEVKSLDITKKPYSQIFIKGKPIISEYYEKFNKARAKKFGFKSLASIPLIVGAEVIGALNIISNKREVFSNSEKKLFASISTELGGAIKKTKTEMDLKRSKARYATILDNTLDIIYSFDSKGKIIFISPNVSLWGYKMEEVLGKDISDFVYSDDLKLVNNSIKKSLVEKKPFYTTFRLLKKNKEAIYAEEFGQASYDEEGNFLMFSGVIRDVTERKKHEEELMRYMRDLEMTKQTLSIALEEVKKEKIISENLVTDLEKFKLAVDGASDHIIITDLDAKIIYANSASSKITGFGLDEMMGNNPGRLWGGQMKKEYFKKMWHMIKNEKKVFTGELKNKRKNGKVYDAEIHISPILNKKGEVLFFVGIEKDITSAKNIDRAKTEFISIASHQLRTPLTGIKWFTELVLASGDKMPKKQLDYVKKIYSSNQKMISLVKDLLDVSRIESGEKFSVQKKRINIISLVKRVISDQVGACKDKKVAIKLIGWPSALSAFIDGDKIFQVFQNLLTNAIKYSDIGGVVEVGFEKTKSSLIFYVRDYGLGIPDNIKNRIFEKFYRAGNVVDAGSAGTGLGLYIAKKIVEAHGGKIWFESKENKQTTFYFELPIK
jgi:PAS domain S-box-containing protein